MKQQEIPNIMKGLEGSTSYYIRDNLFNKDWVERKVLDRTKRALSIRPFTRVIWKSEEKRNKWSERISKAQMAYHDTEWEMTARGKRKCGTIHLDSDNFDKKLEKLTENGLFFYPTAKSAKYEGFSHQHIQPGPNEDYYVYGAFGKNHDDVQSFREYEREEGDHESIGDLLGYPKCCQEKFVERWPESIDPIFESAVGVKKPEEIEGGKEVVIDSVPPEANQMLRYFGIRLTSHLPCNMKCEKTIEKGKEWCDVMRDVHPEGAKYAKDILNMPTVWDANRGIVEVENPLFIGVTTTGYFEERRRVEVNG